MEEELDEIIAQVGERRTHGIWEYVARIGVLTCCPAWPEPEQNPGHNHTNLVRAPAAVHNSKMEGGRLLLTAPPLELNHSGTPPP